MHFLKTTSSIHCVLILRREVRGIPELSKTEQIDPDEVETVGVLGKIPIINSANESSALSKMIEEESVKTINAVSCDPSNESVIPNEMKGVSCDPSNESIIPNETNRERSANTVCTDFDASSSASTSSSKIESDSDEDDIEYREYPIMSPSRLY
jgi:hypothetical protein